ncbi:thioesterase [Amycolatopsis antarctica]|uniref:Thioesterase n=1 Tax=Amycolatopsis antarctica TaxID=1854586 RepID=A0A263D371_9PSEU|nr:alpha/beta fold hydrolase [Amycolatopsis antarctica]OZM72913.1 thioesterase [Amycolatopsis antarctica]
MAEHTEHERRRWLRGRRDGGDAAANLVCLPHAGGSASFYRDWEAGLPGDLAVRVVQYPGREDRLAEPCLTNMAELADRVTEVVLPLFDRPVVLFGHSMGAALMYEVTRRCEAAGASPDLLIASAHPAPHRKEPGGLHLGSDRDLLADLQNFAASRAILESEELREIMLPMVRADYQVIETYELAEPIPVRAPIAVFRGAEDTDVDSGQGDAWAELTEHGRLVRHQVFDGGHFYLQPQQDRLFAEITGLLEAVRTRSRSVAR